MTTTVSYLCAYIGVELSYNVIVMHDLHSYRNPFCHGKQTSAYNKATPLTFYFVFHPHPFLKKNPFSF